MFSASIRLAGAKKEARMSRSDSHHRDTVRHFNGCCPQSQGEIKLAQFYREGVSGRDLAGSQSKTTLQASAILPCAKVRRHRFSGKRGRFRSG